MEPISVVTGAIEIGKKLYELGKSVKEYEIKHQLEQIGDKVRELKQSASELEDENRALREKLRFKSDAYEFRHPFWYEKTHPEQPLCPKCFASNIAAPMGEQGQNCSIHYRHCLVCSHSVQVAMREPQRQPGPSGRFTWG